MYIFSKYHNDSYVDILFFSFLIFSKSFLRPVTGLHGVAVTSPSDGKRQFSFRRGNRLIRHLCVAFQRPLRFYARVTLLSGLLSNVS